MKTSVELIKEFKEIPNTAICKCGHTKAQHQNGGSLNPEYFPCKEYTKCRCTDFEEIREVKHE